MTALAMTPAGFSALASDELDSVEGGVAPLLVAAGAALAALLSGCSITGSWSSTTTTMGPDGSSSSNTQMISISISGAR